MHVPAHYTDQEGETRFPLGRWIADQRTRASQDRLTREETDSLQALAMEWTPALQRDDTPAALPGPHIQAIATSGTEAPAPQPPPEHTRPAPVFRIACSDPPFGLPHIPFHNGSRILLTMPAGADKTTTDAVAVHEVASPACLLLGPHTTCLHQAVRAWRTVSKGSLAGLNIRPTRSGRAGVRPERRRGRTGRLDGTAAPGALVVARHLDAALIAHSHHLPPWEHLVIEEAHRTAEGVITQDHPHAAIHDDDGNLARTHLSLTATQPIPRELPAPGDRQALPIWAAHMPAQMLIGTHHPTAQRPELVETGSSAPTSC
ncbi:helicase associated domain-containing protein [Streptomyces sp. NPDC058289]|uniref:helicase associated domain-containing protein n=1 Tax=Streptomyces sp. NPDC058289 TaxID=3346425 RepID=UPI0036E6B0C2